MSQNLKKLIKNIDNIQTKHIFFKIVTLDDSDFIFTCRSNIKKNKFLNVDGSFSKEKNYNWIKDCYLEDPLQLYFIICNLENSEPIGTVRIYDIQSDSFCWGSWIILDNAPHITSAIESVLLVYKIGLQLGFEHAHFDVRKDNLKVIKFHMRCGAKIIKKTDTDIYFTIDKNSMLAVINKYSNFLH